MQISRIEFRAVWKALGYKYDTIAEELQARFKGREGLSATNLHDKTFDEPDAKLPEDISEYVLSLQPVEGKGNKELYELYRRGLGYLKGDALGYVDPARVAAAVVERFPTEALAERIAAKVPVPSAPPPVESQAVAALGGKVDQTNARMDRLTRAIWGAGALIASGVVVAAFLFLAAPRSPVSITAWRANVMVLNGDGSSATAVLGGDATAGGSFPRRGEAEMGGRKTGEPMPLQPLPGQAVGACPAGYLSLNGACWLKAADQQPPCLPGFYSRGDACYAPLAAAPKPPVGTEAAR
jgi:hypothetical protein